jgi:hypothetical protein
MICGFCGFVYSVSIIAGSRTVKIAQAPKKEKRAAVLAIRRANYTHRRKGVFNDPKYSASE